MVTADRTTSHDQTLVDAYRERFGPSSTFISRRVDGDADAALLAHLHGEMSLEVSLRDGNGCATAAVVEHRGERTVYDKHGEAQQTPEDGVAVLQVVRRRLALQGIDAAVEYAPQRGGRLWVFAEQPVPVEDLHALLRLAIRDQEIDIYPRTARDEMEERTVRAPLGAHPDGGQWYGFVDRAGRPVGDTLAAQVAHFAGIKAVDVRRELDRRPHLREELAVLDPRGPELAQERGGERMVAERQANLPHRGDRTMQAVRAQLAGMGAERYDVGVYDRATDMMLLRREWTPADVEHAVPWLKRMNAQGRDIYIRPTASSGLYLIDDIPAATVERMRADGYTPAAVVETSPGNFQAWVRVSEAPLSEAMGTAVARELAERYDGDRSSANWRHMGRVAGFTNRKPERVRPDGRQPFVVLHDADGARAREAPAILARAQEQAAQRRRGDEEKETDTVSPRERAALRADFSRPMAGAISALGREYQHRVQRLLNRYPNSDLTDLHRLDWMVTRDLARAHPRTSKEDLMRAIREGSPRIDERKRGHIYDYAERTARYVLLDPDVERVRAAYARSMNRDRDRWY